MSKLATLEQQVKEMQLEIERLKLDEAEGSKAKILWKPNHQGMYFFMSPGGIARIKHAWEQGAITDYRYSRQQLFATLEEAEFVDRQRIAKMKVLRRVAELNHKKGWVCDWADDEQERWLSYTAPQNGGCRTTRHTRSQVLPTDHYAAKGVWEKVINEMELDVKLGLWGME